MTNRIKGTFLGFLASFGGVIGWILLNFVGFIAGIAGAGMGILFIIVYTKISYDDFINMLWRESLLSLIL